MKTYAEMEPHQKRVVDEKTELDGRRDRLVNFTEGGVFSGLPKDEQARLIRQLKIMDEYSKVLGERIATFI